MSHTPKLTQIFLPILRPAGRHRDGAVEVLLGTARSYYNHLAVTPAWRRSELDLATVCAGAECWCLPRGDAALAKLFRQPLAIAATAAPLPPADPDSDEPSEALDAELAEMFPDCYACKGKGRRDGEECHTCRGSSFAPALAAAIILDLDEVGSAVAV